LQTFLNQEQLISIGIAIKRFYTSHEHLCNSYTVNKINSLSSNT